jgi:hypothetical protein
MQCDDEKREREKERKREREKERKREREKERNVPEPSQRCAGAAPVWL